jgi:hypothetical protein
LQALKSEIESGISKEDLKEDFCNCLRNIKYLELKSRLLENARLLREAENEKDQDKIKKLIEEADKLAKKLNTV